MGNRCVHKSSTRRGGSAGQSRDERWTSMERASSASRTNRALLILSESSSCIYVYKAQRAGRMFVLRSALEF